MRVKKMEVLSSYLYQIFYQFFFLSDNVWDGWCTLWIRDCSETSCSLEMHPMESNPLPLTEFRESHLKSQDS